MTQTHLVAAEETILASASANAVVIAASGLAVHVPTAQWLAPLNRYRDDTIARLKSDSSAGGMPIAAELTQYIAASCPLHCVDGWSYLGRAIHAHLTGDPHAALHLAYYAELRAAMSLLAAGGIGVFSDRHFVVQAGGAVQWITPGGANPRRLGTHVAAWLYLKQWSTTPDASTLLGAAIRPAGQSLGQWVDQVPLGGSWSAIAGSLLEDLGLDLARFVNDREARNLASYRPTGISPTASISPIEAVAFVEAVWALLEPAPGASFEYLDVRFLAVALERVFKSLKGVTPVDMPGDYEVFIDSVLTAMLADDARKAAYRSRLLQALNNAPLDLVTLALDAGGVGTPTYHMTVIARAASLLRIAAGSSRQLLRDANLHFEDLAFWWSGIVEGRGIWDVAPPGADLCDSWADVEAALDEVRDWRSTGPGPLSALLDRCPRSIHTLGGLEIVPMWELAS